MVDPVSVPGPPPPPGREAGKGPFGERGFRIGLGACAAALLLGLAMVLLAGGAVAAAGTALLALGGVGLVCVSLGLLAERLMRGREGRPPSSDR